MNTVKIDSLDTEELNIYSKLSEVQLLRYNEPKPGIFIAESPNVILRAIDAGYEPISLLVQTELADKEAKIVIDRIAERFGKDKADEIKVYVAGLDVINKLTGFAMTRGILAAFKRKPMEEMESFLFSLGCYSGENITVVDKKKNLVVSIKDARYNIDPELASSIYI